MKLKSLFPLFFVFFNFTTTCIATVPLLSEVETEDLSIFLDEDLSPQDIVSVALISEKRTSTIYKIELADGRVIFQVASMVMLNYLPRVFIKVCTKRIVYTSVCNYVFRAGEAIIDLYGSSISERVDHFFSSRIEGNRGIASIYSTSIAEARDGQKAYEDSRSKTEFPWQAAKIHEIENREQSFAHENIKVKDLISEFKLMVGDRAAKIFPAEELGEETAKIRSLYRIKDSEFVLGAYSDVALTWVYDKFDEGLAFTDKQLYVRAGKNKVGWLSYEYLYEKCKVHYVDEGVVIVSKSDNKRWDISVADSEIESGEMAKLIRDIAARFGKPHQGIADVGNPTTTAEEKEIEPQTKKSPPTSKPEKKKKPSKSKKTGNSSSSLSKAVIDYHSGRYQPAFTTFTSKRNIKKLNGEQYFCLGMMYYEGKGTAKNTKAAFTQFKEAGSRGNKKAMNKLVYMYENGVGVKMNQGTADLWKRKAAK